MVVPVGLLTVPACRGVRRVMLDRFVAPLQRGPLERRIVLGAALVGACSAVVGNCTTQKKPAPLATIQAAVNAATPTGGDTISVCPGTRS